MEAEGFLPPASRERPPGMSVFWKTPQNEVEKILENKREKALWDTQCVLHPDPEGLACLIIRTRECRVLVALAPNQLRGWPQVDRSPNPETFPTNEQYGGVSH